MKKQRKRKVIEEQHQTAQPGNESSQGTLQETNEVDKTIQEKNQTAAPGNGSPLGEPQTELFELDEIIAQPRDGQLQKMRDELKKAACDDLDEDDKPEWHVYLRRTLHLVSCTSVTVEADTQEEAEELAIDEADFFGEEGDVEDEDIEIVSSEQL